MRTTISLGCLALATLAVASCAKGSLIDSAGLGGSGGVENTASSGVPFTSTTSMGGAPTSSVGNTTSSVGNTTASTGNTTASTGNTTSSTGNTTASSTATTTTAATTTAASSSSTTSSSSGGPCVVAADVADCIDDSDCTGACFVFCGFIPVGTCEPDGSCTCL